MTVLSELRHLDFIGAIDISTADTNPIIQCKRWIDEAVKAGFYQPNAMTLATVGKDGTPSARTVLLKDISTEGFTFYTHFESRKGKELAINPHVALLFYWDKLERQIRIEGMIKKVSDATADAYFATRPRETQISAWASPQSKAMKNREQLEQLFADYEKKFSGKPVPRPSFWGGFLVAPHAIEFWQGRPSRLHDRLRYEIKAKKWQVQRLAP